MCTDAAAVVAGGSRNWGRRGFRGALVERDSAPARWVDLRGVTAGELCLQCAAALDVVRAVEVGHVFKLGRKYTGTLGVSVLGPDGDRVTPIMGSYGIGIERALACVVEIHRDDTGIVRPVPVALAVALGGDCLSDSGMLRAEPAVFGRVASDPTVSRLVDASPQPVPARSRPSGEHSPTSASGSGSWPVRPRQTGTAR